VLEVEEGDPIAYCQALIEDGLPPLIIETNRIHLVLCGVQNRTFGPSLAAIDRLLMSVMAGSGRDEGVGEHRTTIIIAWWSSLPRGPTGDLGPAMRPPWRAAGEEAAASSPPQWPSELAVGDSRYLDPPDSVAKEAIRQAMEHGLDELDGRASGCPQGTDRSVTDGQMEEIDSRTFLVTPLWEQVGDTALASTAPLEASMPATESNAPAVEQSSPLLLQHEQRGALRVAARKTSDGDPQSQSPGNHELGEPGGKAFVRSCRSVFGAIHLPELRFFLRSASDIRDAYIPRP
jgi:hypothetical protein